jgi:hypothetical protein
LGAAAGACLALVGRIVFDWLRPKKANGSAGERSVEYWQIEFRRAVRCELDDFELRRDKAIREIVRDELDSIIRLEFDRDPRRR